MIHRLGLLPLTLVLALLSLAAPSTASGSMADPDWKGDRHVMPEAYSWLGPDNPIDTYSITIVRGKGRAAVLRDLGRVKRELGRMTPDEAGGWMGDHGDQETAEFPLVIQVERLGHAVVIFQTYGFRASQRLRKLSSRGIVADFGTTVELDSYATVARRGKVIRQFDVLFRPPREGALPQEQGLDFGARGQNQFAQAWAFNERLTLTHISREWFEGPHPTFVLRGTAF